MTRRVYYMRDGGLNFIAESDHLRRRKIFADAEIATAGDVSHWGRIEAIDRCTGGTEFLMHDSR